MMTNSKRKETLEKIRKTESYLSDRKFLVDLVSAYKNVSREKTYELHDIFTSHAVKENWSRRKLDVLLDEILKEIIHDNEYSQDISDLLNNYLDALEGNVASSAIIRLNNDPKDPGEFRGYVRRGEWWKKDQENERE